MSKIELPPLPEPDVMCDCGGDYFTAAQLRARDRQIVELCAALCERYNVAYPMHGKPHLIEHEGLAMHNGQCYAAAIRSLLDEKKENE